MKKLLIRRLLASLLALAMVVGLVPGAFAVENGGGSSGGVSWRQVDNDAVTAQPVKEEYQEPEPAPLYEDSEQVRVSILLEGEPTIAMFAAEGIAENEAAVAYREELQAYQEAAAEYISEEALGGGALDVVWNLTLAANIISANVEYGQVDAIRAVEGVDDVVLERRHEVQGVPVEGGMPSMGVALNTTGASQVWESGYTGAGMRIAVIDTGLDIEHQSFNSEAFDYALAEDAERDGVSVSSYDLLDKEEISAKFSQLNVARRDKQAASAVDQIYRSSKIPFGYNYIDRSFDVTHVNDTQGEHGSHVAGITSANRYLKRGGGFVSSMDEVKMTGAAPDAQTLVMKVFGKSGGAWESDYMAAVEDAIVLGCDAANISINYAPAGFNFSTDYQDLMDRLSESGIVVTISSANYGRWADWSSQGDLYSEDVSFATSGEPASYANTMSVASVDNHSTVALGPIVANGVEASYRESDGPNLLPLSTMDTSTDSSGTTYDYVFIDGYGKKSDFEGLDLEGKVVFCSRGKDVDNADYGSYTVKVINAMEKGAACVIIYNNVDGANYMNLFGGSGVPAYNGTKPAVMIDRVYGQAIKEASTPVAGNGKAYTGKITIHRGYMADTSPVEYEAMSVFTSWGGPGDLTIKPEISAPGGNIWSLNGLHKSGNSLLGGHEAYEMMMGTSMAAPHVAGVSTLLKQYIETEGLSRSGVTDRALIQSLVMSTAKPMKDADGNYYPVIRQGAGMVDAPAAVGADSYILMGADATASWRDGKIKAELGDDPARTGRFSFSFTINNLDHMQHTYALSADVFTQDTLAKNGQTYLSTATRPLSRAVVQFDTGGANAAGPSPLRYDFDGSGAVNEADGTALLDYVTGSRSWSSIYHQSEAYFGRDVVDSYSAHLFLRAMNAPYQPQPVPSASSVTVPAGGSATVTAAITLDQSEMNSLLSQCPNGVYVEAFVKADAQPASDGTMGTSHSIPVLGFYGNWSDPSLFDKNSYPVWEKESYLSGNNGAYGSYVTAVYGQGQNPAYFGGNPYTEDEAYLPARNALNTRDGGKLSQWYFAQIRGSAAGRLRITNAADSGEVYLSRDLGRYYAANNKIRSWDNTAGATSKWQNARYNVDLSWAGTDASGAALPEGTTANLTLTQAPEYYAGADGGIDWNSLGKGASLTSQVTIDNTAPEILDVVDNTASARGLAVTALDRQYIAYIGLYTADGSRLIAGGSPNQTVQNQQVSMQLDLAGVVGKNFLLQVSDYAKNTATFELSLTGLAPAGNVYYTGFEFFNDSWASYDAAGNRTFTGYGDGDAAPSFCAGAYAGGYLFAYDLDKNFYVMDPAEPHERILIQEAGDRFNFNNVVDMAYDASDGTMYFIDSYYGRDNLTYYELATVDLFSGECRWIENGPNVALYAIAGDGNGTLYGVGRDSDAKQCSLYRITNRGTTTEFVGNTGIPWENWYEAFHSMAWDSAKNELVLAMNGDVHSYDSSGYFNGWYNRGGALYTINPETARSQKVLDLDSALVALYTPAAAGEETIQPVAPAWVEMSMESMKLLKGNSVSLRAKIGPWNARDRSVVWSSSDSRVASVDQSGRVTAHQTGTVTVTAASASDASVYGTCEVAVQTLGKTFDALVWDKDGHMQWSTMTGEGLPGYQATGPEVDYDTRIASVTESHDGKLYAATHRPDNDDAGSVLYRVEPDTKQMAEIATLRWWSSTSGWYNVVDVADAPHLQNGNGMVGINNRYIFVIDKSTGGVHGAWNWGRTNLVGIAYMGSYQDRNSYWHDCYAVIDANGDVYREEFFYNAAEQDNWSWNGTSVLLARTGYSTGNMSRYNSASYGRAPDGTPYLFWSQYDGNEVVNLLAIELETGITNYIGSFEEGVWPAVLVTEYDASFDNSAALAGTAGDGSGGSAGQNASAGQGWTETDPVWAGPALPPPVPEASNPDVAAPAPEEIVPDMEIPNPEEAAPVTEGGEPVEVLARSVVSSASATVKAASGRAAVRIVLDEASTNGKVEITYNAGRLTLSGARGLAALNSINSSERGKVVLAYAYKDAAQAGTEVAELVFESPYSVSTTLTVTTLEDGTARPGTSMSIPVVITVPGSGITEPDVPDDDPNYEPGVSAKPDKGEKPQKPAAPAQPAESAKPEITIQVPSAPEPERKKAILSSYEDLDSGAWYSDYAALMISSGLMVSTSSTDNRFSPDEPLTRGMLATVLYRAAGEPDVSKASVFNDVQAGSWYDRGVSWAEANGLVNGYGDGTFKPDRPISRQELAVILWRMAQKMGIRVTADGDALPEFTDRDEIADWAAEAICWAYRVGIITGYGDGSVGPAKGASRIETAAMVARFLALVPAAGGGSSAD